LKSPTCFFKERTVKNIFQLLVLGVLLCNAPALWAQKLAPGLWESTVTMKDQSGENNARATKMQEQMAKMPPEERKLMEQMMAKQGQGGAGDRSVGNLMDMMAGKPTTMRVCITPEQAARDFVPPVESRCKADSVDRSGKTLRMKLSCGGNAPGTVETEMIFASDKAYSGTAVVNTVRKGKSERMDMTQVGRWLASDCGNVKPLGQLPPSATPAPPAK
jgi:hypothetical protein